MCLRALCSCSAVVHRWEHARQGVPCFPCTVLRSHRSCAWILRKNIHVPVLRIPIARRMVVHSILKLQRGIVSRWAAAAPTAVYVVMPACVRVIAALVYMYVSVPHQTCTSMELSTN